MAQVELYTLLRTYSQKNFSPSVDLDTFVKFLEKNASRTVVGPNNLEDWKTDTRAKVMRALNELVEKKKVSFSMEGGSKKVVLRNFYADIIARAYISIHNTGQTPFPTEETLRIKVPMSQTRILVVKTDLFKYLNEEHTSPAQIIRLVFEENYGSALTLEAQYPEKILEVALTKISDGLRQKNELEYFNNKLVAHFKGQEMHAKEIINMLISRPMFSLKSIEESDEFTFSFWFYLCPLIISYIEENVQRSGMRTNDHIALVQAASIVLVLNNYYQSIAREERNKENVFEEVFLNLLAPPYMYTVNDMINFKNKAEQPLLQNYSPKDLEVFIRSKTTVTRDKDEQLIVPPLLKFKTHVSSELYVRKERVFTLCMKLIGDGRNTLKNYILDRWEKLMRAYRFESAMENDLKFEELLSRAAMAHAPLALDIIQDKRIAIMENEVTDEKITGKNTLKIYQEGRLLPLRTIFALDRKDTLKTVKLNLPFWYSFKTIVNIARFFNRIFKRNKQTFNDDLLPAGASTSLSNEQLVAAAKSFMGKLVPSDTNLDSYIETVGRLWNQSSKAEERERLSGEVNNVIKMQLNQLLTMYNKSNFSSRALDDIASAMMRTNGNLFNTIKNTESLFLYIKLYIIKILLSRR